MNVADRARWRIRRERARWRRLVRSERAWRLAAAVLLVGSAMLSARNAYDLSRQGCESRAQGREDVRAAIVAGVDEVASYAELDPPNRELVTRRVEHRVYSELPPPGC